MPLPSVPQERDYGAVQADAQLAAMAPAPLEATPAQADEASFQEAVDSVQGVVQGGQQAPPEQQPQPQKPNAWRIPTNYQGVLGVQQKSLVERAYDIGMMWQALALDPRVDPVVKLVADSMIGKKR